MNSNVTYDRIERRAHVRGTLLRSAIYLLLGIWGLIVLFPFYWMILSSIKSYSAYNAEHIPKLFTRWERIVFLFGTFKGYAGFIS